jgi:SAM-dependent methyltransferase
MSDARYNRIGVGYAAVRRPDPRFARAVRAAIGETTSIVNVGAGTGSYEPTDVAVVAVEPSEVMIAQRSEGSAPVVRAVAEALPFDNNTFDVATAFFTVHHWNDAARGIAELQRVSGRQVILTWDARIFGEQFWFACDYFPQSIEQDQKLATAHAIVALLGEHAHVQTIPIPADCTDGFFAAYWQRPEAYLDHAVRAGMSAFSLGDPDAIDAAVTRLRRDLESGAWEERYGHLRELESLDLGYRLVSA